MAIRRHQKLGSRIIKLKKKRCWESNSKEHYARFFRFKNTVTKEINTKRKVLKKKNSAFIRESSDSNKCMLFTNGKTALKDLDAWQHKCTGWLYILEKKKKTQRIYCVHTSLRSLVDLLARFFSTLPFSWSWCINFCFYVYFFLPSSIITLHTMRLHLYW